MLDEVIGYCEVTASILPSNHPTQLAVFIYGSGSIFSGKCILKLCFDRCRVNDPLVSDKVLHSLLFLFSKLKESNLVIPKINPRLLQLVSWCVRNSFLRQLALLICYIFIRSDFICRGKPYFSFGQRPGLVK